MVLIAVAVAIVVAFVFLRHRNFVAAVEADPTAEQVRRLRFFVETALMVGVNAIWIGTSLSQVS